MLHGVFRERSLLMVKLAEQCTVKPLFEWESEFVGVGVQVRPGALINNGNAPMLAPFATNREDLAIHGFPSGIYQFRDTEHSPQQEANQCTIPIRGIVTEAYAWDGFKEQLKLCWTQCLRKRRVLA